MTTRKPKLNLLYVADTSTPWLQLAVATTDNNPSVQHARQWQSVRFAPPAPPETAVTIRRKH
jgi:hypothetical protein